MNKAQRHEAIRDRARRALADLYHNATPEYPRLPDDEAQRFQAWFEDTAQQEIEYIRDGGANGSDPRATFEHPANAGKFKSKKARAYYVRKSLRDLDHERNDCGMFTGWRALEIAAGNKRLARQLAPHFKGCPMTRNNALWECISEYGELYQYGRGGRTLAPKDLIRTRGGSSFSVRADYADELSIANCLRLIAVVESFNRHVTQWNDGIPEAWADYESNRKAEERSERARKGARNRKEKRERKYWEARDVQTKH